MKTLYILLFINLSLYGQGLEKVSLQLQWKHQFQFAGYYIAKEKGFYKDANLDVDIKELTLNKSTPVDRVIQNEAYYGIGRSSLIKDKSDGKPITILSAIFQSSPLILMTSPKSNIRTIEDLEGKTIMLDPTESATVSINAMLSSKGLSTNDMKQLNHTFNLDDLVNGVTDVATGYISSQPYKLKKLGLKTTIFNPKDYGFDFYNDILFTSTHELKKHPLRVKRFNDASIRGWEYAFNNIEETVDLILKKYNTQNRSKDQFIFEANELKKLAYFKTKKIGVISEEKIKRIFDIYNVMGLVKKKIDLDEFIAISHHDTLELTINEKEYLKKKKTIKMCVHPNDLPLEEIDNNGNHQGISKDIIKIISNNINQKFVLIPTKKWTQSLEKFKNQQCDIIPLTMQTPDRLKYMNFTNPYITHSIVVVTSEDKFFIQDSSDLKNKKIGVVEGYAFAELLKQKHPSIEIITVKNAKDGLQKVQDHELFAFVDTLPTVAYIIQNNGMLDLKVTGKLEYDLKISIASRKDEPLLNSILQKALNNIDEAQIKSITGKWISIKVAQSFDYRKLLYISLFFLSVVLVIAYKNRSIKKINNELDIKNKQLKIAVQNKDILMREVYHRVKNNLQVVSSLLALDSKKIDNTKAKEVFLQNKQRILSISLIHEQLYQHDNLEEISLPIFLEQLISELKKLKTDVIFTAKCQEINIELNIATHLALVINEIVTNSLKYAFVDNSKENAISISIYKESHQLLIKIADNGSGSNIKEMQQSFGFELITALIERQLKGSYTLTNKDGLSYLIKLDNY